jgi:ABC-type bacteriocin/lantibiotic exporter with double-glycine peptidase domain
VPTEQRIAAMLSELRITRIFAAHRPDTVAIADRVLVLTGAGLSEVPQRTAAPDRNGAARPHSTRKGEAYASAQTD